MPGSTKPKPAATHEASLGSYNPSDGTVKLYETTPCICDKICSVFMPVLVIGYVDGTWPVPDIVVRRIVAGCGRQRSGHRAIVSVFVGSVRREAGLPAAAGRPRHYSQELDRRGVVDAIPSHDPQRVF